jgi:CheY-like chemotaxis protein
MGVRVLLIEDNPGDVLLVKTLLSESVDTPFTVDSVNRLSEAKDTLCGNEYDVILLDLGLPDSWGMDTLTEALEIAGRTPIVVLTGNRAEGLGSEVNRMGAQDYLVKGEATAEMVERSILYSIERKKAQDEVQHALQTYADLVREIPSGLLTFQYAFPDGLLLVSYNPQAEEILGRDLADDMGKDLSVISPFSEANKHLFLETMNTHRPVIVKGGRFQLNGRPMALDLRAFSIPGRRLCVSVDDATDRVREEELRRKAYSQIEKNIEHFASLVDEIRNPNSVIIGLAERMEGAESRCIILQAERIESIVNRLDAQWVASETVRRFLSKTIH